MKIHIAIKEQDGTKKIPLPCCKMFEMFGYKFAAHKSYPFGDKWNVSEMSSGFRVFAGFDKDYVIKEAMFTLENAGQEKVKRLVTEATE